VYLGAIVVMASAFGLVAASLSAACKVSGVPVRSAQRWATWWTCTFACSSAWAEVRARFAAPAICDSELPLSLLERVHAAQGRDPPLTKTLMLMARLLAPMTTTYPESTRIVRDVMAAT